MSFSASEVKAAVGQLAWDFLHCFFHYLSSLSIAKTRQEGGPEMTTMSTTAWVVLGIAVAAIVTAGLLAWKRRRSKKIRSRFGPEYEHLVQERGSAGQAEKELEEAHTAC
jgi:hypothetical protein